MRVSDRSYLLDLPDEVRSCPCVQAHAAQVLANVIWHLASDTERGRDGRPMKCGERLVASVVCRRLHELAEPILHECVTRVSRLRSQQQGGRDRTHAKAATLPRGR